MTQFSVLFATALVFSIAAMSADSGGVRDQVDLQLTDEVETLLDPPALREFAGLDVPVTAAAPAFGIGAPFIEIPPVIADGYRPLVDLDVLYGVAVAPVVPTPAYAAPPVDLVDDTPAVVASIWASPPLDAK
jgi:hypothetical protein